jgi:hypothetical protein
VKDLSRHIEYLLCEHNSVAIPGIGLFITEDLPARYFTEENLYIPPVRSVYLDTTHTDDDGKLENCLIQLHRLTHSVAKKWIEEYVENINHTLIETGHMDIGTIGRLTIQEGNFVFDVCEAGVNTPELYGLDSFHMPKLPVVARKKYFNKDATHFTIRLRRTTVHRVMTAVAMIIIAFTVIMPNYKSFDFNALKAEIITTQSLDAIFNNAPEPISTPNLGLAENSDIPENQTEGTVFEHYKKEIQDTTKNTITETTEIYIDQTTSSQQNIESIAEGQTTIQKEEIEPVNQEVKGYCVVMASAITHSGAEHLINKLSKEGFTNASKHMDNGMLRVVLTGYHSKEAARAALAIVRATDNLYSGSWIKHF